MSKPSVFLANFDSCFKVTVIISCSEGRRDFSISSNLSIQHSVQDVTSFDFHASVTTMSSLSQQRNENDISDDKTSLPTPTLNEIEIEVDPLNEHECMPQLIKLIEFMREEKIYDVTNAEKLPGRMESSPSVKPKL